MLKHIQSSHDFSDTQPYNKIVKLEEKKLVVFPEKHNDVFWKTLRAFWEKVVTEIYQPFYLLLIRIDLLWQNFFLD